MKNRFISLDILRGLTIALMITVNTPGSWAYVYPPFLHAHWHGCTLTDLVFPFFLFVVGGAMVFSFKKHHYTLNAPLIRKIIKRTFLIFIIGLLLNAFPFVGRDYEKLRIMGVLQRIGLAYGFGAFAILLIKNTKHLILFSVGILFLYWGGTYFGAAYDPYSLETNFGRMLDLQILGEHHMWHGKKIPFDPEGLWSTLPSIVSVIGGFVGVRTIVERKYTWGFIIGIGVVLIGLGWVWSFGFPINKSLWTSSYVLLATGWGMVALGCIEGLSTVRYFDKFSYPFIVLGSNPLFIFVLSIVVVKTYFKIDMLSADGKTRNMYGYIYHDLMVPIFGHMNGSLMFALTHLFVFFMLALWMFKKNIFVKI